MVLLRKQGVKRLTVLPTFLFSVNVTGKSPNKRRTAMPEDNVSVEQPVEAKIEVKVSCCVALAPLVQANLTF
jgi:hypothetical protein